MHPGRSEKCHTETEFNVIYGRLHLKKREIKDENEDDGWIHRCDGNLKWSYLGENIQGLKGEL